MQPTIETIHEKKLAGKHAVLTFNHHTPEPLWQSFMPHVKNIHNKVGHVLYSLEVYPPNFFNPFDPSTPFTKWAAVEVVDYEEMLPELEQLVVPAGQYAVFIHRGPSGEAAKTYEFIFREWLPASAYQLDERPHFAVMDERYKKDDPTSEEEIWIPIKEKTTNG